MDKIKKIDNAFFGQMLFIGILLLLAYIIYGQLSFLGGAILGSFTLYCTFRPCLQWLTSKRKWKPWLAALLLLALIVVILSAFGFLAVMLVAAEIPLLDTSGIISGITELGSKINQQLGYEVISEDFINNAKDILINIAKSLANTTYGVLVNFSMMLMFLYFMFANGPAMERAIIKYAPFKGESLHLLKQEVKNMIQSNAIGIPLIMLTQGLMAALGYWIFGMGDVGFWAFMTALFGLVPVVGSTIVWLPVGVYLISIGLVWQGVAVLIYGAIVIANVDNALRLVLMKKMADTHPLTTILGVMIGIPLFGFWGIIFGPLLLSGFILLIKIYYKEYELIE